MHCERRAHTSSAPTLLTIDRQYRRPVTTTPRSHRWTEDEVRQLTALAARGLSEAEIARALGRTVAAVRTKAAHNRIALPRDSTTGPERLPLPWERRQP
jgi:DNA-binding NarL/FixJ family response regulator